MPRNNRRHQLATMELNPGRPIAPGASAIQPQPSLESLPETTLQPAAKPNPRFLSLLLQALIMAFVISLFFIFVGVAAIIFIHLCIAGGALHRRRQRRRPISGDSSPGYSPEELKALPKSRFRGSEMCAICLDHLSDGEICRVLPDCKHVFHLNCVDKWLSKVPACPVCRSSLRLTNLEADRTAVINWEQLWAACGQ